MQKQSNLKFQRLDLSETCLNDKFVKKICLNLNFCFVFNYFYMIRLIYFDFFYKDLFEFLSED